MNKNSAVCFVVQGDPVAWARAAQSGRRKYTPERQRAHMKRIAQLAKAAGVRPLDGPVYLEVVCIYSVPQRYRRKNKSLTEKGLALVGTWKTTRPDASNELKIIEDALNGIAYHDDSQICAPRPHKIWGTCSRTIITIRPAYLEDRPRVALEERAGVFAAMEAAE